MYLMRGFPAVSAQYGGRYGASDEACSAFCVGVGKAWRLCGGRAKGVSRAIDGAGRARSDQLRGHFSKWTQFAYRRRKNSPFLGCGDGKKLRRFEGLSDAVNFAAFAPDGRRLFTGSEDGTAKLEDAEDGEELASRGSFTGGGWAVVDPEGHFDTNGLDGNAWLHYCKRPQAGSWLTLALWKRGNAQLRGCVGNQRNGFLRLIADDGALR